MLQISDAILALAEKLILYDEDNLLRAIGRNAYP